MYEILVVPTSLAHFIYSLRTRIARFARNPHAPLEITLRFGHLFILTLICRTPIHPGKVTERCEFLLGNQSINCEMRDSFEVMFWLCRCDRNCQCTVAWCRAFGQANAFQKYQPGQKLQWNCQAICGQIWATYSSIYCMQVSALFTMHIA